MHTIYQKVSLVAAGILSFTALAGAQTNFAVTAPNFIYAINGSTGGGTPGFFVNNSPPLTLQAGNTYKFNVSVSAIHPMVIGTNFATSAAPPPASFEYGNASPQLVTSGTVTLTIPATGFPSKLYYQCNNHGFYGVITVVAPPSPPPPNQILSVSVITNVTLVSTGTNTTWVLVPEFNSNLVSGTWATVPGYSNFFANGTNTTTFPRLEAICGPNVYLRLRQNPP